MQSYDIRTLQLRLLRILKAFDIMCRNHGLRYYLEYGTLLGAVRHGGFIPWDDDLDIMMPRPDYELLIKHSKEWMPEPYEFVCFENDPNYPLQFGKVQDASTTLVERPHLYYLGGAYIDVFPMDGVPESEKERKAHAKRYKRLKSLLYITWRDPYKHGHGPSSWWPLIMRKIYKPERVQDMIRELSMKYPFETSKYVANLFGQKLRPLDREKELGYGTPKRIEYAVFMNVINTDARLTQIYGDYMTTPPPKEIQQHGFFHLDLDHPYRDFDPSTLPGIKTFTRSHL